VSAAGHQLLLFCARAVPLMALKSAKAMIEIVRISSPWKHANVPNYH
jgi:hypothetical protein